MSLQSLARPDLWKQAGYKSLGDDRVPTLRLNCNENPWPPQGAADPLINRYPEKQPGELVLRLAQLYDIAAGNLLITRGADDGIDALIRSFCLPGQDAIVQCSPAFVMYEFFARLQAVDVINVPLNAGNGFAVEFNELPTATNAKIYFLCSPNNPTGSLVDPELILQFAERVADQALVVVDEAYIEFAEVPSLVREATQRSNLVVLRTLSKAWSLAGARLGVVIGTGEMIGYLQATTSPYPLSRASVAAALSATREENMDVAGQRIQQIKNQRERLKQALDSFGFVRKIYPSEANFLLVHVDDSQPLLDFMNERGILLRDQSSQPGLQNHVRISVGTDSEMDQLVGVLGEFQEVLQ